MKPITKCFLQCLNKMHEPILLGNLKTVTLGRSAETKIKEKRCSKNQVELTANYEDFKVTYKHLGANNGCLNGSSTKSGEIYKLFHGDTFEFLSGQFPHKIIFDPEPPLPVEVKEQTNFEEETVHSNLSTMPKKAASKRAREETAAEEEKPSKNIKENEWENLNNKTLLVYNRLGGKSNKIASYDMDGTLITTLSGKVFAKDINDWKIIYPQVPGKLKELVKDGYKIVLFTNQAGVATGKVTVNQIQTKIASVIKKLGVPAQALVATSKGGKYRKPVTGMWDFLIDECNGGMKVDLNKSMYVGDAAGRPEIPKQKKKDHSNADRLFALNIEIPFFTPEEHFLGNKPSTFKMPEFMPNEIDNDCPLYKPTTTKVPNFPLEVILMVGFPGSGKSTFVEKHLLKLGYIHVNRDTMGTWQKCLGAMESAIQDGKHVVVDNTNPDKESRGRFIKGCREKKVPIRCFVMNISMTHSKHNNKFRELSGSSHSRVSDMIYNMYKSKYVEPTVAEGFEDIVKVNFKSAFKSEQNEEFYKTFLLES